MSFPASDVLLVLPAGSGPSKNGRRSGGGATGFAHLQENGAQDEHASLGSQDSLEGHEEQGRGTSSSRGRGRARRCCKNRSSPPCRSTRGRMAAEEGGLRRVGGWVGWRKGAVGVRRPRLWRRPCEALPMGDAAQEKALQPHEPLPQPSALAPIRDPIGAPIAATTFTFKELERATRATSRPTTSWGRRGSGECTKGKLESTGQVRDPTACGPASSFLHRAGCG